jgi:hypothetical protein
MKFLNKIDEENNCIDCIIVNDADVDTPEKLSQFIELLQLDGDWIVDDENYNGGYYNASMGKFILPKPYPSFILNEDDGKWYAPVPHPQIEGVSHVWDESRLEWIVVTEI